MGPACPDMPSNIRVSGSHVQTRLYVILFHARFKCLSGQGYVLSGQASSEYNSILISSFIRFKSLRAINTCV
jgi:hypothetical protein